MGVNRREQIIREKIELIRAIFNENLRMPLTFAATQAGLHCTTTWKFLKRESRLYPYKTQKHQNLDDMENQYRIGFTGYSWSRMKNSPEFWKEWYFPMRVNCCFLDLSTSKTVSYRAQNVLIKLFKCQTTDAHLKLGASVQKESSWALRFRKKNVTEETFKSLLLHYTFPKLRQYPEGTLFKQNGAPPHLLVPVCQCFDGENPNHWIKRAVPISWAPLSLDSTPLNRFYGSIRRMMYTMSLPAQCLRKLLKPHSQMEVLKSIHWKQSTKTGNIIYGFCGEKKVVNYIFL